MAGISEDNPSEAAAGVGKTTAQMKKKGLWNKLGFDPHYWLISANQYPKFLGIDNIDDEQLLSMAPRYLPRGFGGGIFFIKSSWRLLYIN